MYSISVLPAVAETHCFSMALSVSSFIDVRQLPRPGRYGRNEQLEITLLFLTTVSVALTGGPTFSNCPTTGLALAWHSSASAAPRIDLIPDRAAIKQSAYQLLSESCSVRASALRSTSLRTPAAHPAPNLGYHERLESSSCVERSYTGSTVIHTVQYVPA